MAKKGNKAFPWRYKINSTTTFADTIPYNLSSAPTLAQWLCHGRWEGYVGIGFRVDKVIAAQINSFGIADAFHRYGRMNVTIIDMSGVDDLPNVVACEILRIPCSQSKKVIGYEHDKDLFLGKRSNPTLLGFNEHEMHHVEFTLRMMDCTYYCALRTNISVLHSNDGMFSHTPNKKGWSNCCENTKNHRSPKQAYEELKALGCQASRRGKRSTWVNSQYPTIFFTFSELVLFFLLFFGHRGRRLWYKVNV